MRKSTNVCFAYFAPPSPNHSVYSKHGPNLYSAHRAHLWPSMVLRTGNISINNVNRSDSVKSLWSVKQRVFCAACTGFLRIIYKGCIPQSDKNPRTRDLITNNNQQRHCTFQTTRCSHTSRCELLDSTHNGQYQEGVVTRQVRGHEDPLSVSLGNVSPTD
jgi:hypothetical protein